MRRAKVIIGVVLSVFFIISCSSQQLREENAKLKNELDSAKNRLGEMEAYTNDLKGQISSRDSLLKAEIKRVEEKYEDLMDSLKKEIASGEVQVKNIKGVLTLNMADRLFFDSGKAELRNEGKEILTRIGEILKKMPEKVIRVEGHTDNVAIAKSLQYKYPTNWELGAARAVTVVRYFTEKVNIDSSRISAVTFSEYRPLASNDTEEGKSRNRRIEIVLLKRQLYQMIEIKESINDN